MLLLAMAALKKINFFIKMGIAFHITKLKVIYLAMTATPRTLSRFKLKLKTAKIAVL